MANVIVGRSVNQAISETVLVRDIGDRIVQLEPDVTPLLVMTTNAGKKRATISPRIEMIEDDLRSLWGQVNQADVATAGTTFDVVDGTLFAIGDLIQAMLADTGTGSGEIMRVTGITTNELTITRAIGGDGDTLGGSAALRIIGSANAENATLTRVRSTNKTTITSYAQIFKTPTQISNTQRATLLFGEVDEDYQLAQALKEHKKEIEGSGLWGKATETLASPASIWTTMGLKDRISTNVTNMSVTMTLQKFNTFSETAFRYGSPTKLFIAAPIVISAINFFAQGSLRVEPVAEIYGTNIRRLVLPHGELMLARNFMLEDGVTGQPGYNDEAYAVDLDAVEYRFLSANGVSRDTKLFRDMVKDGTDGVTHSYITQAGWLIDSEQKHSRIHNASDSA